MKKANKPDVVIISGDNNKVTFGGGRLRFSVTIAIALFAAFAVVVLAISHSCPELLADFINWVIQHCD